jgi:branched-chain amino acid aminotransferase
MQQYINLNGAYQKTEEPALHHTNRGFQYGDALFETMHANGKVIQFFDRHMERLTRSMGMLKMEIPPKISGKTIENEIVRLLHKNRHLKGARVRLTVFRNPGGKYTPEDNSCSYLIETSSLEHDIYQLNDKGLFIDVFPGLKKPIHPLSNLNTTNDLIHVMAGLHKKEHGLDECLLLNEKGEITEAINSNVFIMDQGELRTPPLASGCLEGIMREQIIECAREINIHVSDSKPLTLEELMKADEVFLTNAIKGIQWVGGIRQKRYFKQTARKLLSVLNEKTAID